MDEQQIKQKGVKLTKHKLAILQLFNHHKHLDANRIYSLLNQTKNNISLATVYRILSALEINKILIKHNFQEELATYELVKPGDHHDHLVCIECHNLIEFCNNDIEAIQEQIAKRIFLQLLAIL